MIFAGLVVATLGAARAADTHPVVGPGATKDEAIDAYGWPTGQSQLGTKEILNYPQGSITLDNGRVERVDFSTKVPWPAPRPRPGTPAEAAAKLAETKTFDPWTTSFPDAVAQAAKQHARILAAFVGSDWSPPSQRFLTEVATHPEFVNGLMGDFVFLRLDFPTRVALPAELKQQNEALRARCGVTTYPALVVLSPRGDPVAVVDLTRESAGESYRAHLIAAVDKVRDLLKQQPLVDQPPPRATPASSAAPPPINRNANGDGLVNRLMAAADSALALGLGGGLALATLLVWLVWRSRPIVTAATMARADKRQPAVRLRDLPSLAELKSLPAGPLRQLVAALFEAKGYTATMRTNDRDIDIELRRRGHPKPSVLIGCRPGSAGPIGARAVREFFGSLVAASVDAGWIVSPGGFADEARPAAAERGLELIDGEGLIDRLRQLPAADLGAVLSRAGA